MPHQDIAKPAERTPTHAFRISLFSKERTYRLEPDALAWSEGERSGRVRYADIRKVALFSMPPAMGKTVRRTVLSGSFGKLKIASMHFIKLGRFEDRADSYFAFVEELLARVTAANPGVEIKTGHSWPLYLFWVLMFGISVLMLPLLGLIALDAGKTDGLPAAIVLVMLLPVGWRIMRRGRPRKADASALYSADLGGRPSVGCHACPPPP